MPIRCSSRALARRSRRVPSRSFYRMSTVFCTATSSNSLRSARITMSHLPGERDRELVVARGGRPRPASTGPAHARKWFGPARTSGIVDRRDALRRQAHLGGDARACTGSRPPATACRRGCRPGPALAGEMIRSMSIVGSRNSVEYGSESALARRLRVHEHRGDHEHRDAEHELAAHRPAQVAHVGIGAVRRVSAAAVDVSVATAALNVTGRRAPHDPAAPRREREQHDEHRDLHEQDVAVRRVPERVDRPSDLAPGRERAGRDDHDHAASTRPARSGRPIGGRRDRGRAR